MVRIGWTAWMAGPISMQARHEVVSAHFDRYRAGTRGEKSRLLDEIVRLTGWHRKHAIRALSLPGGAKEKPSCRRRKRRYGAVIEDALGALWEASDRLCGKRAQGHDPRSAARS